MIKIITPFNRIGLFFRTTEAVNRNHSVMRHLHPKSPFLIILFQWDTLYQYQWQSSKINAGPLRFFTKASHRIWRNWIRTLPSSELSRNNKRADGMNSPPLYIYAGSGHSDKDWAAKSFISIRLRESSLHVLWWWKNEAKRESIPREHLIFRCSLSR